MSHDAPAIHGQSASDYPQRAPAFHGRARECVGIASPSHMKRLRFMAKARPAACKSRPCSADAPTNVVGVASPSHTKRRRFMAKARPITCNARPRSTDVPTNVVGVVSPSHGKPPRMSPIRARMPLQGPTNVAVSGPRPTVWAHEYRPFVCECPRMRSGSPPMPARMRDDSCAHPRRWVRPFPMIHGRLARSAARISRVRCANVAEGALASHRWCRAHVPWADALPGDSNAATALMAQRDEEEPCVGLQATCANVRRIAARRQGRIRLECRRRRAHSHLSMGCAARIHWPVRC
jgi:hypothetical protein